MPDPGHFCPIPGATSQGAGRRGRTRGLGWAAAKRLPQAGRQREARTPLQVGGRSWAPQELAPDPCKAAPSLWGRSSCLNPVPQERHLLVIGTMEMAGWVLDLAPDSELPRRQRGGEARQDRGRRASALPSQSFPSSHCSHVHHQVKNRPSQKCSQSHRERSLGRGEELGSWGGSRGGAGLPVLLPHCWGENPVLLSSMCPWGCRAPGGGRVVSGPSCEAPPHPLALRSLSAGPHGALEGQLRRLPEQGACSWVHHGGGGEELVPAHGQGGQVQLL